MILFSGAELIAGAALMAGLLTPRGARLGWLLDRADADVRLAGCYLLDEWTMAACNLAMGATLVLAGSGAYSLDNVLLKRNPGLADRAWFRWLAGGLPLPLTDTAFRNLGLAALASALGFNIGTYSYYLLSWLGCHAVPQRGSGPAGPLPTAGRSAPRDATSRSATALCWRMVA